MRLLLDANVIFAACWSPQGRASALLRLASADQLELLASPHGIEEARRNLSRKRPTAAAELEQVLRAICIVAEPSTELVEWAGIRHALPAGDAPILAAAIASRADALVTGDSAHFGHLYDVPVQKPAVLRLVEALALIRDA